MEANAMRAARSVPLVVLTCLLCAASAGAVEIGEDAPKFANPNVAGEYLRSSVVFGKKWVVVNFFATWCVPCKEELPTLEALQDELGAETVQVIVFATDKEKNDVKSFFEQRRSPLTVLLDPYQVTYLRFDKAEDGLPTTFLIGPDGKIAMKGIPSSAEFIAAIRQRITGGGAP
jgi:peroxiredoxin